MDDFMKVRKNTHPGFVQLARALIEKKFPRKFIGNRARYETVSKNINKIPRAGFAEGYNPRDDDGDDDEDDDDDALFSTPKMGSGIKYRYAWDRYDNEDDDDNYGKLGKLGKYKQPNWK